MAINGMQAHVDNCGMPGKKRLDFLDCAKGIAIFLVVMGHFLQSGGWNGLVTRIIYSFHMPFFFIAAGFTHKKQVFESYTALKEWLIKKARRLLVPYMFMMMLSDGASWRSLLDYIRPKREILSNYSPLGSWFLPGFFCSIVIYQIILQITAKSRKPGCLRTGLAFATMISGLILCRLGNMYFYFNNAMVGVGFIEIGAIARSLWEHFRVSEIPKSYRMGLCVFLFALTVFAAMHNETVYMVINCYGSFPMAAASGICGSLALLLVCSCFDFPVLRWLGINSVAILQFHTIYLILAKDATTQIRKMMPSLFASNGFLVLYRVFISAGIVLAMIPLIVIINNRFPAISGREVSRK